MKNSLSFYQIVQLKKHGRLQNACEKKIADQPIYLKNGLSIHTTVSIGCAYSHGTGADIKQLPIIADQELYKAKESGRNQVSFSERKKDLLT
ncbi:diguanylate cyclase [Bacillus sp. PK5-004]